MIISSCIYKWFKLSYHYYLIHPKCSRFLKVDVDRTTEVNFFLQSFKICLVFSGILMDKTIGDKLMYIPNDDTQNYPFCSLKLLLEMFKHST